MLEPAASPSPSRSAWPEPLIWAGALACVIGLVVERMWHVLPAARFGETLLLAALAGLLAWPLRRVRNLSWADALALIWLLALVAMTGLAPALAVSALTLAAIALGGLVTGDERPLLALVVGLALIAGVVGWLLPLPVHHWWTYAPLLATALVLRRRALAGQAASLVAQWRVAVAAAPRAAAVAVLLLGLASTGAWLPTMQHDDVAYHLGLPWQLLQNGHYALDPTHQVWALAPWAGDVLQAVAQVLARQEARGALNVAWLLASAAGLWQIGTALQLRPAMRWSLVALFASLPQVAGLLGGMQTETAATAVTIALAALIYDRSAPRRLLAIALLYGLLWALKPLHGVAAAPLLAWAAWSDRDRIRSHGLSHGLLHGLPLALVVVAASMLLVAGSSYLQAWRVAGNPVLPLFNDVFASPYFAHQSFADMRWQAGSGVDVAWQLTFATARYLEGWNGGIGFVLVALAGAWLLALVDARTRALAWCASLALLLPLLPMQYARYLHPGMALLLPALVAMSERHLAPRRATWLLLGLCGLNLAFQANAQWFLHTGAVKRGLLALGSDGPLLAQYVPERLLIGAIRQDAAGSGTVLVMDPATPAYAELAGRGRTTAWYDPHLEQARLRADGDASGSAWIALLRREGIAELIVRPAAMTPAQRAGLARVHARREQTIGQAEWWRVPMEAAP